MEKPSLTDMLIRAVADVGPVGSGELLEAAQWQGYSHREFSSAIQTAIANGDIRLDWDMKWVTEGGTGLWY